MNVTNVKKDSENAQRLTKMRSDVVLMLAINTFEFAYIMQTNSNLIAKFLMLFIWFLMIILIAGYESHMENKIEVEKEW